MGEETKIFQPGGEMEQFRLPELDFDYEDFRNGLIPEWQVVTDRLIQTDRGVTVMQDELYRAHVVQSSNDVELISSIVSVPGVEVQDFKFSEFRNMYYRLPSLIDISDRQNVLEFISEGMSQEIESLDKQEDILTALLRRRRLASVYEELSTIDQTDLAQDYANLAYDLNRQVSESDVLDLATSPRKLHARFAIYDIYFRRIFGNGTDNSHTERQQAAVFDAQSSFYYELTNAIETTRFSNLDEEALSGSFGELLVLGRIRDKIINEGRINEIEASQSFIRQDYTDKSRLVNPPRWKWAYDLSVKNVTTGKEIPVEVKKLRRGLKINGGGGPSSYVPIIEVVQFRLGRDKQSYLKIIEDYCKGKSNYFSGITPTNDQMLAIELFEERVDNEIDRVFSRLENPSETATDYFEAKKGNEY